MDWTGIVQDVLADLKAKINADTVKAGDGILIQVKVTFFWNHKCQPHPHHNMISDHHPDL